MDINNLNQGEKIAGVSAVLLLFFALAFSWFSVGPIGIKGFEAGGFFRDVVMFFTIIAGIGLALIAASSSSVNAPVAPSAIVAGLGILQTLLVVIWVISPPGGDFIDAGRSVGLFLGLLASAGVAYGGWMAMQEEGTSFSEQADRLTDDDQGGSPPSAQ